MGKIAIIKDKTLYIYIYIYIMSSLPWTDIHQKKYLWLFNYLITLDSKYKSLNPENYVLKFNKRTLIKIIKENNNWGDSSKESIYFTVARWLERNDKKSNFIQQFKQLGYELKDKRDKQEGENKLDAKEKDNIQPFDYFVNILNNIKIEDIKTKQKHYEHLILALLVLQPPVRTSFYTSAIITTTMNKLDDKNNYIYIKPDQVFYIINKDKVSNTKKYKTKNELSFIDITDKKLIDLLNDSISKYPRNYLFENDSNQKGIKDETFLKYLRNITLIRQINIDMMRSIYITHYYKYHKTYKAREELALKMRHSIQTASKNYLKLAPETEPDKEVEQLKEENIKLTLKIKELEDELNKLKNNKDEKHIHKLRTDIIYKANKKQVKPKEDTMNKYNIKFNEETNQYYY